MVPFLYGNSNLSPNLIRRICISDFIVIQPRSSCKVWLAGAYDVCRICRAMRLTITFISCLNLSRDSLSHASVPYKKTVLTHVLASCSCLWIGRLGSLLRSELVFSAALDV